MPGILGTPETTPKMPGILGTPDDGPPNCEAI
ncbi:hypothetical protein X474_03245 [Dethiosulfatarculus sandiegensis]|uniref:Uncharacterized protein n=1 Tax=Dethiosulfatarculus sandiegensis TaxID=1429043 RepID=A0A0D2JJB9_9BACT|nr:hypothetical protein X474_03245 [Dethiosulfatarculus sandiegensis]